MSILGAAPFVAPAAGSTVFAGAAAYTYVDGVGYVMGNVQHYKGRLTHLQINIEPDAQILVASSTTMTIRGSSNTAVIEFVPSRGYLRVDRITVTPHVISNKIEPYLVPTIMIYGADAKLEVEHRLGESLQHHRRYCDGLCVELTLTHREAAAPKVRRLHDDVMYSRGVYTLTIPGGRVQASPTGRAIDTGAIFGRLAIKGSVYKFTWGGSSRKFRMVGDILEDACPPRTSFKINPDVTQYSDGSYDLATPEGLVRYDPNHRATMNGASIRGTILIYSYKYTFEWLDKSRTFIPGRDSDGQPAMIDAPK